MPNGKWADCPGVAEETGRPPAKHRPLLPRTRENLHGPHGRRARRPANHARRHIIMVQVETSSALTARTSPTSPPCVTLCAARAHGRAPFPVRLELHVQAQRTRRLSLDHQFRHGRQHRRPVCRAQGSPPPHAPYVQRVLERMVRPLGSQARNARRHRHVQGIDDMLQRGISFSLYMAHGGTTFGHWGGANCPPYTAMCSSYDYDAPISEAGWATPKYHKLRALLEQYADSGQVIPDRSRRPCPSSASRPHGRRGRPAV